jgi:hypothetical protein
MLGPDWFECIGSVPIAGAPPEMTGLPHPVLTFGQCGNRWSQSAVDADRKVKADRARMDAEAKAQAEAEIESARLVAIDGIASAQSPLEALLILRDLPTALPTALLRDLWLRLLGQGNFRPSGDMVTLEGRQTALGYFLSRGSFTTQWGHWEERDRQPVFLAEGAGHQVIPAHGESWEQTHEGFDVWLDSEGALWSGGWSPYDRETRLAIGNGGHRSTSWLVVEVGRSPSFRRRKAKFMGWEIRVPDARAISLSSPSDLAYTRAITAALEDQLSKSG